MINAISLMKSHQDFFHRNSQADSRIHMEIQGPDIPKIFEKKKSRVEYIHPLTSKTL